jgi:DNA polymerase I-like protein with 3'-5' exonuclease and polymerase domains
VDTQENCFFDLVPERFLVEFCEVKNKITEYVAKNVKRPVRYNFYKHVSMMLQDLSNKKVTIDAQRVSTYLQSPKLKNHAKNILSAAPYVRYNQFGTKTGRLTTKKGSFPILTMSKEFRSAVKPQNDYFVELDFNGAEVRTLLGLLGKDQPPGDVHDFHLNEIFTKINTRDQAKVAFFAWLYGSKTAADQQEMTKLAQFYEKDRLLEEYWDGTTVRTPFKKEIPDTSEHHALNYLVQSTAAELTLKQALKIEFLLRNQSFGSHIAFLIHDAIVIDMKKEDDNLLKSMVALMASTNFGKFKVNIKRGKTLGSMKDIQLG